MKRPPAPGAWSLLVIDSVPIREKAKREYDKVARELERAKHEVERFHAEDQPKYAKWLNSHFGALLTESRELQEKLFQLQGLVSEVQQEFFYGNHTSIYKAYRIVVRRREHPEEFQNEMKEAEAKEDEIRRDFEDVFGKSEEEFFAKFGLGPEAMDEDPWPKAPTPAASRIKDLYRSLARRLHPDAGGNRSAREVEWWHQTQAAYEQGDIEQLELILTLAEIQENGTKEASISILQQITSQFKQGLNALKRELRQHRRDAAWNFSRLEDYEPLRQRTREMLEAEKAKLAIMLQRFQLQIQSWEALANHVPARPRRRARASAAEQDPWF